MSLAVNRRMASFSDAAAQRKETQAVKTKVIQGPKGLITWPTVVRTPVHPFRK